MLFGKALKLGSKIDRRGFFYKNPAAWIQKYLPKKLQDFVKPPENRLLTPEEIEQAKAGPGTPIIGPGYTDDGGKIDRIPTEYEQVTGIERLEFLAKLADRNIFLDEPLKVDHYGTMKNPIMVPSIYDERIVGCTGYPKYSHSPLWIKAKKESPGRCFECGQVFKLEMLGFETEVEVRAPKSSLTAKELHKAQTTPNQIEQQSREKLSTLAQKKH